MIPFPKRLLAALCSILITSPPTYAAPDDYTETLIQNARQELLSLKPQWHKLLHYQPDLLGNGVTSLVDDESFFIAGDGKINPQAELEATIKAFFSDAPSDAGDQHPQCRFIARYHWLKQQLHFDPKRLKPRSCTQFDEWIAALKPQSATLIFPTAYLNNPSSMFGHTLLRIDGEGQDENTRLLAYAVNYAAATGNDGGVLFAVKGLFGGYPGFFSIAPYYLKVRLYNDIENRDIWEYKLNLSQQEILFMLMHLWEMKAAHFDYFFFDENCSYHLLGLLEAARPDLELTEAFRWWAIPSDTVRRLVKQAGLVEDVVYRPSRQTILQHRMEQLNNGGRALAKALASGQISSSDLGKNLNGQKEQAALLEIGYELLNYRIVSGDVDRKLAESRSHALLAARSKIGVNSNPAAVPEPDVRPDQGHGTARAAIAAGRQDDRWFQSIRLRPAYHDLLDPPGGYVRGAQINFLDVTVTRHADSDNIRLEEIKGVDIISLTPRDDIDQPLSWKINAGLTRRHMREDNNPLVLRVNGGAGLTWAPWEPMMFYAMLESTVDAGGELDGDYAMGLGADIGLLADASILGRIMVTAGIMRFGLGDQHTLQSLTFGQRIPLLRNNAIDLRFTRRREFGHDWNSINLGWHVYF